MYLGKHALSDFILHNFMGQIMSKAYKKCASTGTIDLIGAWTIENPWFPLKKKKKKKKQG